VKGAKVMLDDLELPRGSVRASCGLSPCDWLLCERVPHQFHFDGENVEKYVFTTL